MYYVYVLLSQKDNYKYIGCTNDLKKRFKEHNSGQNKSTADRKPFKIIYYEAFLSKEDAYNREKNLKMKWGNKFLERILTNYFKDTNSQP